MFPFVFVFSFCRKNFLGTQKRIQISHGKQVIESLRFYCRLYNGQHLTLGWRLDASKIDLLHSHPRPRLPLHPRHTHTHTKHFVVQLLTIIWQLFCCCSVLVGLCGCSLLVFSCFNIQCWGEWAMSGIMITLLEKKELTILLSVGCLSRMVYFSLVRYVLCVCLVLDIYFITSLGMQKEKIQISYWRSTGRSSR